MHAQTTYEVKGIQVIKSSNLIPLPHQYKEKLYLTTNALVLLTRYFAPQKKQSQNHRVEAAVLGSCKVREMLCVNNEMLCVNNEMLCVNNEMLCVQYEMSCVQYESTTWKQ